MSVDASRDPRLNRDTQKSNEKSFSQPRVRFFNALSLPDFRVNSKMMSIFYQILSVSSLGNQLQPQEDPRLKKETRPKDQDASNKISRKVGQKT